MIIIIKIKCEDTKNRIIWCCLTIAISPIMATKKRIAAVAATPPSTGVPLRYITALAMIVSIKSETDISCEISFIKYDHIINARSSLPGIGR